MSLSCLPLTFAQLLLDLLEVAEGDNDKISPRDRWGGTPLGDSERGLRKDPTSENFAACVKLFQEAPPHDNLGGERDAFC